MFLIVRPLLCRKVNSKHLKTVSKTDVGAGIHLILDRAPILNTPSCNRTRASVPRIVPLKALDGGGGHKDAVHSRRVIKPC